MWLLGVFKAMGVIALIICLLKSSGSIQEAWKDNNDKYFFMYSLLSVCSMGGIIYLLNV